MGMSGEQKERKKVLDALKRAWLVNVFLPDNPRFDKKDKDQRKLMNQCWFDFRAEHGFPVIRPGRKLTSGEILNQAANQVKKNAPKIFSKKTAAGIRKAFETIRGNGSVAKDSSG